MKWERYNKMTSEQKEEYHYRFDKYNKLKMPIDLYGVIVLFLAFSFFIFGSYVLLTNEQLGDYMKMFQAGAKILQLITLVMIMELLLYITLKITGFTKEYKWLKARGI